MRIVRTFLIGCAALLPVLTAAPAAFVQAEDGTGASSSSTSAPASQSWSSSSSSQDVLVCVSPLPDLLELSAEMGAPVTNGSSSTSVADDSQTESSSSTTSVELLAAAAASSVSSSPSASQPAAPTPQQRLQKIIVGMKHKGNLTVPGPNTWKEIDGMSYAQLQAERKYLSDWIKAYSDYCADPTTLWNALASLNESYGKPPPPPFR